MVPPTNTLRLGCSLLSNDCPMMMMMMRCSQHHSSLLSNDAAGRDASFPEASSRDDAQPEEEAEKAAPRCSVVSWVGVETVRPQPTWVDGHQASVAAEQSGAHTARHRALPVESSFESRALCRSRSEASATFCGLSRMSALSFER